MESFAWLYIIDFTLSKQAGIFVYLHEGVVCNLVHEQVHALHLHRCFIHHARPDSKEYHQNIFQEQIKTYKNTSQRVSHGIPHTKNGCSISSLCRRQNSENNNNVSLASVMKMICFTLLIFTISKLAIIKWIITLNSVQLIENLLKVWAKKS